MRTVALAVLHQILAVVAAAEALGVSALVVDVSSVTEVAAVEVYSEPLAMALIVEELEEEEEEQAAVAEEEEEEEEEVVVVEEEEDMEQMATPGR